MLLNSTIPLLKSFGAFRRQVTKAGEVRAVASYGPADVESPYGGIFFYAIHQVDCLLTLVGRDVTAVCVNRVKGSGDAVASLFWTSGVIGSMHCMLGRSTGFQVSVATSGGNLASDLAGDARPYLTGAKLFCKMFKTGVQPIDHKEILARIAVLEALNKSVKTGKVTAVAKV